VEFPLIGEVETNCNEARAYYFSWAPNGSSDPDTTDSRYFGKGASACNYVTGSIIKFTLIDSNFLRIIHFTWGVMGAAAGAQQGFTLELDSTNTDLAAGVLAFALVNASGTRADVAATAGARFYVQTVLSKDYGDT